MCGFVPMDIEPRPLVQNTQVESQVSFFVE
jgi:hypothetical protein